MPKRRKPVPDRDQTEKLPAEEHGRPIKARDLQGLKFFEKIRPLLDTLHEVGIKRDRAKNRDLFMDQYGVLVLMWIFNPILTSLRGLQQASTLEDVQKKLGVGRASLGSLSESVSIFDPEPLKRIVVCSHRQQRIQLRWTPAFGNQLDGCSRRVGRVLKNLRLTSKN